MEATPKKFLRLPEALKRRMQQPLKVPGVHGVAVGRGSFQVVPDELVRV
jgi:hypothetical protein